MGDNQAAGIQQVLEQLAQLIVAKQGEKSSSSGAIISHSEPVRKIELMPNDIKVESIKNYLMWSRRALLLLKAKGLEGFIREESIEPRDKSSPEWKTWDATYSLVAAWILSSISSGIAITVDTIPSAAKIWQTLEKMYSGAGNVMLMAEIEDRLHDLKHGKRFVMDYVAELKKLWTDLDHYDPIDIPDPQYIPIIKIQSFIVVISSTSTT